MIINIAFAQSIGLTALAFVIDKREGTMDRTWASGIGLSLGWDKVDVTQFM